MTNSRYTGEEPCTSRSQVVRYLEQNYQDSNDQPMSRETAQALADQAAEQITRGIGVFGSNVYYLGDEAVKTYGGGVWYEIPESGDGDSDHG